MSHYKFTYEQIIEAKSQAIVAGELDIQQTDDVAFFGRDKHIFIDRVLKLVFFDKVFNIEDAKNETNTILMAGYETTGTTLSFIMLMLAMHPEYQERIYEECKSVVFSNNEDITADSMVYLKYVDMFIKETLRLFPAVPYLTRKTSTNFEVGSCILNWTC